MVFHDKLLSLPSETVLTIGNFDGFHLAHALICDTVIQLAQNSKESVLVTFEPHPREFFAHDMFRINTPLQKKEILAQLPVDHVFILPFGEFVAMIAEDFLPLVLCKKMNMKTMVIGDDFRFGRERLADADYLFRAARTGGFELRALAPFYLGKTRVSSSAIRKLLQAGQVKKAAELIGRPYFVDGVVVKGDGRGRELGVPTVNLQSENDILPPGVFYTKVEWSGNTRQGISYAGRRPTFSGEETRLETHLLDFNGDLYGQRIRIHFLERLRSEMVFPGERELAEKIKSDIDLLRSGQKKQMIEYYDTGSLS